jgi:hypothetical protein
VARRAGRSGLRRRQARSIILVATAVVLGDCSEGSPAAVLEPGIDASLAGASNTWAYRAEMPTARKGLVASAVNGRVYAIGGEGGLSKVEAYDPATNSWTIKAGLLDARRYASGAAVINGKIYVPGGSDGLGHMHKTLFV